jgi:hypothetical protein
MINGLDEDRAFGYEACLETRSDDQGADQIEVGIRRDQNVEASTGSEPLTCLVEERGDVAVVRAGVPGAIGNIARFARKKRGVCLRLARLRRPLPPH